MSPAVKVIARSVAVYYAERIKQALEAYVLSFKGR